jgi:hypothetical protein
VIRRIRTEGIILPSGEPIRPYRIRMALRAGPPAARMQLVGYLDGVAGGVMATPAGHRMTVVPIHAPDVVEFADRLLSAWNRRSGEGP